MSAENGSKLSNPASYGGAGHLFESHVQATFVVLMLSRSSVPCLPHCSIVEIMLQGKIDGYETDDLIVITEEKSTKKRKKLLTQIKRSISFTQGDNELAKVLEAAWKDFNNPAVFCKERDKICLITGPLSKTDIHNVQWILEQARHTASKEEFWLFTELCNGMVRPDMQEPTVVLAEVKLQPYIRPVDESLNALWP